MKSVALEWQKSAPDPTRPSAVGRFVREPVPGPVAVVQVCEDEAASDPDSSEDDSSLSDDSQATLPLDAPQDFPDMLMLMCLVTVMALTLGQPAGMLRSAVCSSLQGGLKLKGIA